MSNSGMVRRYRKLPVEVEAMQYTGENAKAVIEFTRRQAFIGPASGDLYIGTLEGDMVARPLDYIIKGVRGEFYPCRPDIFAQTYFAVEGEQI